MDTVVVSAPFETDPGELVARCRTLDSRTLWPGAVPLAGKGDVLYYQVGMALKKVGTITDLEIQETLSPTVETDERIAFTFAQHLTWPDGHGTADGEYLVVKGSPNTIQLTYRYEPPSTKLIKTKELPAFRSGMEKVIQRYLTGLTGVAAAP